MAKKNHRSTDAIKKNLDIIGIRGWYTDGKHSIGLSCGVSMYV